MKKIAIIILSLLVVLLSSCDLEFSNTNSVFTDSAPVIGGTGSSGSPSVNVAGSDVVFTVRNIEGYVATSWSVTYPDGTVKELPIADSGKLVLPIPSSGSYKVLVQYKLVETSSVLAEMKESLGVISTRVFNEVRPPQGVRTLYSSEELMEKLGLETNVFYVSIGKPSFQVEYLTIGSSEYRSGEKLAMSIGMNAFLSDTAFNVDEDGNLLVSTVLLHFASTFGNDIVINDAISFDCSEPAVNKNVLNYEVLGFVNSGDHLTPSDTDSTFSKVEGSDNTYDIEIRCGLEVMRYCYEGDSHNTVEASPGYGLNTGAAASDIIITRSVRKYADGSERTQFGFDVGKDKGEYLNGYYIRDSWKDQNKQRLVMDKDYIVLDSQGSYKGEFSVVFNITPSEPSDRHQ